MKRFLKLAIFCVVFSLPLFLTADVALAPFGPPSTATSSGSYAQYADPDQAVGREYYLPFYDNNRAWGMNGDWICISNMSSGGAPVDIFIGHGADPVVTLDLAAFGSPGDHAEWQAPDVITDGPIRIVSRSGGELMVSQRTIFKDSFNEVMAVGADQLDSEYLFSWYDNNSAWGMNGDWICVTNLGDESTNAQIFIGNNPEPVATLTLPVGGHAEWQSPTRLVGGPIRVVSDNGQQLLVAQRVVYKESFTESMGTPRSSTAASAYFTWYDNNASWGMNGDWVCATNVGNSTSLVEIFIGDDEMPEYFQLLAPGAHFEWKSSQMIADGPVRVISLNNQPLLASQRTLYKQSFEEVPGTYLSQIRSDGRFPWYDAKKENGMSGNWIVAANIYRDEQKYWLVIGHELKQNPENERGYFTLPPLGVLALSYAGLMGGPVEAIAPQYIPSGYYPSLLASQRVIYKDSFNEVVGNPNWTVIDLR